nr:hypothetical protein [Kouleothrix sp.]
MSEQGGLLTFSPVGESGWVIEVLGYDPALEPTIEAVFALVNGYSGTRAALEEGCRAARPATFVAGVFNTPTHPQAAELEAPIPELVVAPDWSRLRIFVEGDELTLDRAELLSQRRVLDMRQGVLIREWRVRDAAGRVTSLRSLRFASLNDRHALVQLLMLMPENYSGRLALESLVDGRVANENNTVHLAPAEVRAGAADQLLAMRTLQSGYLLAFAAHADLRDADGRAIDGAPLLEERVVGMRWEVQAEAGRMLELRKLVACVTSRDTADPIAEAQLRLARLVQSGGGALLVAHVDRGGRVLA